MPQEQNSILERHDAICIDFEEKFKSGERLRLEQFLARVCNDERPILARHLLSVEVWWRRHRGESPVAEDYLARLPGMETIVHEVVGGASFAVVFEVTAGPHHGRVIEVTRHESLVAGRDESCQLHFRDDHHFSRFHFRLEVNPPAARLIDLDSRNGTLVNGVRTRSAELNDRDEIKAGRTCIRVRFRVPNALDAHSTPTIIGHDHPPAEAAKPKLHLPVQGLPPLTIPGYALQDEIGRGGLGVVYRAIHKATQRSVAIKVMLPARVSDPSATQLFLREANILSQLKHPRIVEFYEFGMAAQQLYIVMELVDRILPETLWINMPWDRRVKVACGIALQTLEGLEFAHARSFVHRDIKPANLLLVRKGRKLNLKLADFGMAKNFQFAGFSDLTDDRDARGSLAYMAPEQVIDCRFAGPSCDIYAVGVTLYHLLSGELPLEFSTQRSALAVILEGKLIPLESRCPGTPPELAALVHRAMERDAPKRFESARQMHAILSHFVANH